MTLTLAFQPEADDVAPAPGPRGCGDRASSKPFIASGGEPCVPPKYPFIAPLVGATVLVSPGDPPPTWGQQLQNRTRQRCRSALGTSHGLATERTVATRVPTAFLSNYPRCSLSTAVGVSLAGDETLAALSGVGQDYVENPTPELRYEMTEDIRPAGQNVSRRQLLIGGASAGSALAVGGAITAAAADANPSSAPPSRYHLQVLSTADALLYGAMADRIFPSDSESPGARDLGFVAYFDGQLASSWGYGDGRYQHDPARDPVTSGHGYQLTLVPRDLYKHVATKLIAYVQAKYGRAYSELTADQQDAVLTALEGGKVDLGLASTEYGYTSAYFFELFQGFVEQALFADPVYGGNVGMGGWKWIAFPGDPMGYGNAY